MSGQPAVVYFDMNVWTMLAKGLKDKDPTWDRRFEYLAAAVDAENVVIPLSAGHYLELWHRSSQKSREDIGRVTRRLSGFTTLAPIQTVLEMEIKRYVARLVGGDGRVEASELLGYGATHAFDSPYGRFRFVESLASADGSLREGDPVEPPHEFLDAPATSSRDRRRSRHHPVRTEALGAEASARGRDAVSPFANPALRRQPP